MIILYKPHTLQKNSWKKICDDKIGGTVIDNGKEAAEKIMNSGMEKRSIGRLLIVWNKNWNSYLAKEIIENRKTCVISFPFCQPKRKKEIIMM